MGTIVSAGYGFICGAYMPISQFPTGLQSVISFLHGTYGTALLRNHAMDGVFREMGKQGFPVEVVEAIKDSVDTNIYFLGDKVSITNWPIWKWVHINTVAPFKTFRRKICKWKKLRAAL